MQNTLVTGGAGFIGSNFVRYFMKKYMDYRIVVYDKLTYCGILDNLEDIAEQFSCRYTFVRGDICDETLIDQVMREFQIDAIVNFAAQSHVDRSLMEPGEFIQTDVYGVYVLLEAARKYHVKRVLQVSTDEVYGQKLVGASLETDPLEPRSPYSASKAGGELLASAYYVSFDVPVVITRGSNTIGPYQYPEKVVPLFITNAIDDLPLPVYGDGLQMRDYQYVLDHCEGIDLVLHKGEPGEIYNLGTGVETRNIDMARFILKRLGKPETLIQHVKDRPGHDRRYSLNCDKIKRLGWRSRHTFEEALKKTIQWYVDNEWWWRKIKNGNYRVYYERQYGKR